MRRYKAQPKSTIRELLNLILHPRRCPVCGAHKALFLFPHVERREKLCAICGGRLGAEINRIKQRARLKAAGDKS